MQVAELPAKRNWSRRNRLIRDNFLARLRRYIGEGHDVEHVAGIFGKSAATVYRYQKGQLCPPLAVIKRFCEQVDWPYEALAGPAFELDHAFAQDRGSFTHLALRHQSRCDGCDNSGAQFVLNQAAVSLQFRIQLAGHPCDLKIDNKFNSSIELTKGYWEAVIRFKEQATKPLIVMRIHLVGFVTEDGINDPFYTYNYDLSDAGVKELLRQLQYIKDHGKNVT